MNNIIYENGGINKLDSVEKLWNKLNKHHQEKSIYFKKYFSQFDFTQRKRKIKNGIDENMVKVFLAKNSEDNIVGYCIIKINESNVGEIESIYVDPEFRGCKIGDNLMKLSIQWFKEMKVKKKQITVIYGNEEALSFYEKYGFYSKLIILEEK